ncbi:NACHT, LRR and PYD domains-containing protein 3-like isoform X1 [Tachysurus fulvidraco]|uniref:NACHT, LRR and PYD domains-containing protein 3-like isoform X1 n=2 Tax=Tachysurus fulvidraco TaxID=1234273 RepID=UPI001FEE8967|nr:NACHT, LRR and PYD domains-containing protein 3-like isoform X1 [Tachysurus fulvidraco]
MSGLIRPERDQCVLLFRVLFKPKVNLDRRRSENSVSTSGIFNKSAFILEEHNKTPVKMSSPDDVIDGRHQNGRSASPEPSAVSMRSQQSMGTPIRFQQAEEKRATESPEPSVVSMKSEQSMGARIVFQSEKERNKRGISDPLMVLNADSLDLNKEHQSSNEELNHVWKKIFKSKMHNKFQMINEGISMYGNLRLLNEIYTELYITSDSGFGHISNEHDVRSVEKSHRRLITLESINYNDIFEALHGDEKPIRAVLTEGIAGIGKTVSVQKFVLDWAEGKANQDLDFIFPFNFRELNFKKQEHLSLLELLHFYFPETKEHKLDFHRYKILFIFDGLDESHISLDFTNSKMLTDPTESARIEALLTNLINRNLLPSAFLWITSRPAASSQIPAVYIDRVTEVQGFNDPQKDEYFLKRITDKTLANKIISHLKSTRSLYIMCHIPVFCWISATVLEGMFSEAESGEIPKTQTQMFTHFLILQIKLGSQKYKKCGKNPGQIADIVFKLGKLAFQQLEKGNLIFYVDDIIECGIDVQEATVYSGVCTQIFIEEVTSHLGKVYSFVHMSVQEHLAAMYVFLSCVNGNLSKQQTPVILGLSSKATLIDLLKTAVDKALQSKNGYLDLFLRFLMGLSLEFNLVLFQCLLTETGCSSLSKDAAVINKEITTYIKEKIRENPAECKTINLFYCLYELHDQSLVQEVQGFLKKRENYRLRGLQLSPVQWSALVFLLLTSEEDREEFNLQKYAASDECLKNMYLLIVASRKLLLCDCNLTEESCKSLAKALRSECSCVRELDLSDNKLYDSGVKLLAVGLKNPQCKLEILRLGDCGLTEESCAVIASVLSSTSSRLTELRLSRNKLGDSGVNQLSEALQSPNCKLKTLRMNSCSITEEGFTALISALRLNPSHLRMLDVGRNKAGQTGLDLLSEFLKEESCKLEKLKLFDCGITLEGGTHLISALISNPSHLKELDLGWNKIGDLGMKLISDLLKIELCNLEILKLHDCNITMDGCVALAAALSSKSPLRELDLSCNDLGDQGVKLLTDIKENEKYTLEKLEL